MTCWSLRQYTLFGSGLEGQGKSRLRGGVGKRGARWVEEAHPTHAVGRQFQGLSLSLGLKRVQSNDRALGNWFFSGSCVYLEADSAIGLLNFWDQDVRFILSNTWLGTQFPRSPVWPWGMVRWPTGHFAYVMLLIHLIHRGGGEAGEGGCGWGLPLFQALSGSAVAIKWHDFISSLCLLYKYNV